MDTTTESVEVSTKTKDIRTEVVHMIIQVMNTTTGPVELRMDVKDPNTAIFPLTIEARVITTGIAFISPKAGSMILATNDDNK